MSEPDCRVCENCIFVDQIYPSIEEPIIVRKWCRCSKTGEIFLTQEDLRKAYIQCPYRQPKIGYGLPSEILDEINEINFIVMALTGRNESLIDIKPEIATLLASPCYSVIDFEVKIGALASLLEMNISLLRTLLDKYNIEYGKDEKSIKLLKRLFKAKRVEDASIYEALDFLKKVVNLRNKLPPYHRPSTSEAREIMRELGIGFPAENSSGWQKNSEILLKRFLEALRILRRGLRTIGVK